MLQLLADRSPRADGWRRPLRWWSDHQRCDGDATASTYDDKLSPDRCRARLTPSSTPSVRHPTSCPSVRPPNNTIWSPTPDAHSATRKSGHSNGARRADRIAACCPPPLVTHTHTHPFNCPLSGTTRVSRYQKGKTNLDFTEAIRDSEWQWHQLGGMQVHTLTHRQTD